MPFLPSPLIERALDLAISAHCDQRRKLSGTPYVSHPIMVAWTLLQAGFTDENWLAAALLHDVIEDTAVTREELAQQFPAAVIAIVDEVSEQKLDATGQKRSWSARKQDHLEQIRGASAGGRAVTLADKLHNLTSIVAAVRTDPVHWTAFNASPAQLVCYYQNMIEAAAATDPELASLYAACQPLVAELSRLAEQLPSSG